MSSDPIDPNPSNTQSSAPGQSAAPQQTTNNAQIDPPGATMPTQSNVQTGLQPGVADPSAHGSQGLKAHDPATTATTATKPEYEKLRFREITQESTEEEDLLRYRQLEEMSWTADEKELQNLAWILRLKQIEAKMRATDDAARGEAVATKIEYMTVMAVIITGMGWARIMLAPNIQIGSWQLVLATSSAVLLIIAIAALLFRVVALYQTRSHQNACEADATRQIEIAVRLMLCRGITTDPKIAQALSDLGLGIVKVRAPTEQKTDENGQDSSAISATTVKEVSELIIKIATLLKKLNPHECCSTGGGRARPRSRAESTEPGCRRPPLLHRCPGPDGYGEAQRQGPDGALAAVVGEQDVVAKIHGEGFHAGSPSTAQASCFVRHLPERRSNIAWRRT